METRLCVAEPQENGENDVRVSPEEGATLSDFALGQTIWRASESETGPGVDAGRCGVSTDGSNSVCRAHS